MKENEYRWIVTGYQIAYFPEDFKIDDNGIFSSKILNNLNVFKHNAVSEILPNEFNSSYQKDLVRVRIKTKQGGEEIQVTSDKINYFWHNTEFESNFDLKSQDVSLVSESIINDLISSKKLSRVGYIVDFALDKNLYFDQLRNSLFTNKVHKNLREYVTSVTFDEKALGTDLNLLINLDTRIILSKKGDEDRGIITFRSDVNTNQEVHIQADLAKSMEYIKTFIDMNTPSKILGRL